MQPPSPDRGFGLGFALGFGACAAIIVLTYAAGRAGLGVDGSIFILLGLACLGVPVGAVIVGAVWSGSGRKKEGLGMLLGGVAGLILGLGTCVSLVLA